MTWDKRGLDIRVKVKYIFTMKIQKVKGKKSRNAVTRSFNIKNEILKNDMEVKKLKDKKSLI